MDREVRYIQTALANQRPPTSNLSVCNYSTMLGYSQHVRESRPVKRRRPTVLHSHPGVVSQSRRLNYTLTITGIRDHRVRASVLITCTVLRQVSMTRTAAASDCCRPLLAKKNMNECTRTVCLRGVLDWTYIHKWYVILMESYAKYDGCHTETFH